MKACFSLSVSCFMALLVVAAVAQDKGKEVTLKGTLRAPNVRWARRRNARRPCR